MRELLWSVGAWYVDTSEEKSKITSLVLKNGIRFEQYEFHGGKAPIVRTYFKESGTYE